MAKIFQIVSPRGAIDLDPQGEGAITFTVTNLARSVAARAVVIPSGETDESWLSIDGDEEQDLPANGTAEWTVKAELPAEAPPGEYPFRVDIVSELSPDEDFSEGPEVKVVKSPAKKRRWWWLVIAAVLLVILLTVLLLWIFGGEDEQQEADAEEKVETMEIEDPAGSGEKTVVGLETPNLMGLSQQTAREKAEILGLEVEPTQWMQIESLEIAGQTPKPGDFIKENGTIILELESEVPDLVRRTSREALSLLEGAGLVMGEEKYEISEKQVAGQVIAQIPAPAVSVQAGSGVDVILSLGSCSWTSPFGVGYGLQACRSGSALAGLACVDSKCNLWQLRCCPYLPSADLGSKTRFTSWVARGQKIDRSKGVIDALALRDGKSANAPQTRARYLETVRLTISRSCEVSGGQLELGRAGGFAATCREGFFVDYFQCLDKRCNNWLIGCCGLATDGGN